MIKGINVNPSSVFTQYEANKKPNTQESEKTGKVDRIEELKSSIKNGSYKIDLDKTAKAMAKFLS